MDPDHRADTPTRQSSAGAAPASAVAAVPGGGHALALRLMLSFTPAAFERRFVAHYIATYHRYAQAALGLGLMLVAGDFLIDWWAYPQLAANWLRLQLATPILVVGLAFTFAPQARAHWQPVLAGFIVAVACCLFWILLRIDAEGGAGLSSWVGILNFTFLELYCFVILGVQFRVALVSGLLILAAFTAALWARPSPSGTAMAYWSYHVATLFILSAGIGWWREFLLRKDFATRVALDEARQAAERLAQTKSEFLATMSHEIRTPMAGVLGMNELLIRSALTPQQRAWAEAVQTSGRHLLALINDVLDVSKIEADRLALEAVDFDLHKEIENAVAMFVQPAQAKGLTLATRYSLPQASLPLRGDPLRLRQIVTNLIGNAVKFTEHGGVDVHTELLAHDQAEARVRISVEDTGIGIAPQAQARIFEQFSQADSSMTRRYGGSGLGLAISRQLIELMGGRIAVESRPGQGSRFVVDLCLPVARPQQEAPAELRPTAQAETTASPATDAPSCGPTEALVRARHRGQRVLLAEDNPINRQVAEALLRSAGVVVESAADGAKAVAMVQAAPYDLVLMDVQMPVMDGLQATRLLRKAGHALPIIAMTANARIEDQKACLAAGMDDHVAKPVEPDALYALLLRWLALDRQPAQRWAGS